MDAEVPLSTSAVVRPAPALVDGAFPPGAVEVRDADGETLALEVQPSGWQVPETNIPNGSEVRRTPDGPWHPLQLGGWSGRVDSADGGVLRGWAQNDEAPSRAVTVVALVQGQPVACAVTDGEGRFQLRLPATVVKAPRAGRAVIVIAGSDFVLDQGRVPVGASQGLASPAPLARRSTSNPVIAIKISTPNLKEAPFWGDYHFANSLTAAFARIGLLARVDTEDSWYSKSNVEDVVLTIRGRHQVKLDPGRINLMWLISHPDRIPDPEFATYDHVAVASDVYARTLREAGLADAKVLHQATDATLFGAVDPAAERLPACLFVGNSRREYRTMVKWCRQQDIPLELYGGGWDGVLPPGAVRAASVANADLPECYGSHLLLLNDHWDSMRGNGFLSNRLFDGSATGTPILTDPVAGLEDVFGDTIAQTGDPETFADKIRDCLANPAPWLARAAQARATVLGAHTFDHRAASLAGLIGLSFAKDPDVAQHAAQAVPR
ncbi:hypothetical protein JANAI62_18740 [Jannaschia pagri]|uniref:Spore protein YkvP/CgeB glycosyl transferase-like domain-containing protein n=1 Tax=Jannaschia pagri TaxID=2829797 RepID=A0ABQ4NLN4_9RHOB|nr:MULTISPECIES: glycosyltransferase [unclassified Jannaschia]GIT91417.1 hypothetical protein JANAI61_18750 [Jannaschia sp. AI_61]GIT95251.1 hypothetical protein JANAI62_18740 [Jannaschia sp. AI_62]